MWCLVVVVVLAYCHTAGWDFWGEVINNFNETEHYYDLFAPVLGLPKEHVL